MTDRDPVAPRKRLRVGHVSERGGVNAVRTLLEAHELVVAEVDGRSDYGRDLIVDITENSKITGSVIGIQVKGDRRFICDGSWKLPATGKDIRYWAESSVPVVGILWDPDSGELRWTNLTAHALTDPTVSAWPPGRSSAPQEEPKVEAIPLTDAQQLNEETLPQMLEQMRDYLRRMSATALLGLFDADADICCRAIHDCWAIGRTDARAFVLLRRALPVLEGESLRNGIIALSYLTPHPDIFWHDGNWIPPEIKRQVQPTFRWSAQEVAYLISFVEQVEQSDEPGRGWERGGLGQSLWMLLTEDPGFKFKVPEAIQFALAKEDLDSAFRLLVIHQYLADDPLTTARDALQRYPALQAHWYAQELLREITEFGFVSVY